MSRDRPTASAWFHRRGELARDGWESIVDPTSTGLAHTGLRIAELNPGDALTLSVAGEERLVVPLAGSFTVKRAENGNSTTTELTGRASVFAGRTDVLYLSCAAEAVITGSGRVAVASSPTTEVHPSHHLAAADVPVELRGGGPASREVHDLCTPAVLAAARMIVCEVVTPSGNWSSYPPHKHDSHRPGAESSLEEIYYFEAAPVSGAERVAGGAAFGSFATYASDERDIAIAELVRSGDIALEPYGYHGPAAAAPGYDLYYLNVMAGPDPERLWLIADDPDHEWVRRTWPAAGIDPRLPFTPLEKEHR